MNKRVDILSGKLDVFNIIDAHGLNKSMIFYFFGSLGAVCLLLSLMILPFGLQDDSQQLNNKVLNQINEWNFSNKKEMVLKQEYRMTISNQKGQLFETEKDMSLVQLGNHKNSLKNAIGILDEDESNSIIIPSVYHHLTFDILHSKQLAYKNKDELCVTLKSKSLTDQHWHHVQGLLNCGVDTESGVVVRRRKHVKLSTKQMMLQGVCKQGECEFQCVNSGGIFGDDQCDSTFTVTEICMVVGDKGDKKQLTVTNGCFGGYMEKLSLRDSNTLDLTIRDARDPYLTAINLTKDGMHAPSIPQLSSVLAARKIFFIGSLCFFICAALLIIFNFQKKSKPIEIELREMTSDLSSIQKEVQLTPRRTIPLNY